MKTGKIIVKIEINVDDVAKQLENVINNIEETVYNIGLASRTRVKYEFKEK